MLTPEQRNAKRVSQEHAAVRKVIRKLERAGWELDKLDDGEEWVYGADLLPTLFELDDAWVWFSKNGITHAVYFVFGNGAEDVVCDYSYCKDAGDSFSDTMENIL